MLFSPLFLTPLFLRRRVLMEKRTIVQGFNLANLHVDCPEVLLLIMVLGYAIGFLNKMFLMLHYYRFVDVHIFCFVVGRAFVTEIKATAAVVILVI